MRFVPMVGQRYWCIMQNSHTKRQEPYCFTWCNDTADREQLDSHNVFKRKREALDIIITREQLARTLAGAPKVVAQEVPA